MRSTFFAIYTQTKVSLCLLLKTQFAGCKRVNEEPPKKLNGVFKVTNYWREAMVAVILKTGFYPKENYLYKSEFLRAVLHLQSLQK